MNKPSPPRQRSSHIRNLIGFSAFVMLMVVEIVAFQSVRTYKQTVAESEQSSARLARILADHTELTFLGVDLSLRRAIERQYFNSLFGNNLPEYTEQNFKVWLNETPQIAALALINEHGEVEVAAHKKNYEHWLDYHQTMVGQQLFEHMRDADDSYVFIGKHYTQDENSLIIMSRRYNRLDGEFGGIVVAAINPDYFVDFYNSIAAGGQKFMALTLTDGTVLASGPFSSDHDLQLSRQWLSERPLATSQLRTTSRIVASSNKIISQKQLKRMPLIVSTVLDENDYLQAWRQGTTKDAFLVMVFITFGAIVSYFAIAMARQILRVQESEGAAILASQAKSEFLANMSHELRTPLNAIIGFSEMINSGYFGPLNPRQKERIHDINLCGSHLLQLITDILEFSKGDAGKLELAEEKVDMAAIVNEGVRIMNGKIKAKAIQLAILIEPGIPLLWGDKRKIRQILINLLSNAIKFTPESGAITLSVRLDPQNNMQMLVSDTGIGIAEQDINKALSVFGQVHRSKNHEGTGLGLPLCKMYAELHDGKLLLTSKVGEGTSVRIMFPHQRVLPARDAI